MMNQLNKVNNINTINTSDLVENIIITQKISEIENKINDHDHAKYIFIQEFNKLTADNNKKDRF